MICKHSLIIGCFVEARNVAPLRGGTGMADLASYS